MIPSAALQEINRIVGPRHLITNNIDAYSTDATKLKFMPDAVAFPANSKEISQIFLLANRDYFPVIPRGAGSGKSGGALPVNGGLVLAMDRLNRILSIDRSNLISMVEPGVITARFKDEVEKAGLFYPPDPASIKISSLGGNVAECAGGLRAVKYGVTRDYVLGLTVVLPTGEIIKTGVKTAKGVAGYDLTRLIVGSEGTLAVITSITLRLIPKPIACRTMVAFFRDVSSAMQTVSGIIRSGIVPTTLEFMDKLCIDCIREEIDLPIPSDAGALLLIEVDGDKARTVRETGKIHSVCAESGALEFKTAEEKNEIDIIWETRRNVSEAILKLRPDKISEDIVVPRNCMTDLVDFLDKLCKKYNLPIPCFGHAGDGNIHVNIMLDKNIKSEVEKADSAVEKLFQKVVEMGGTITGEHGIGITKSPYIEMEISRPALKLMIRLKKAFDPMGILNPGKIFPEFYGD